MRRYVVHCLFVSYFNLWGVTWILFYLLVVCANHTSRLGVRLVYLCLSCLTLKAAMLAGKVSGLNIFLGTVDSCRNIIHDELSKFLDMLRSVTDYYLHIFYFSHYCYLYAYSHSE